LTFFIFCIDCCFLLLLLSLQKVTVLFLRCSMKRVLYSLAFLLFVSTLSLQGLAQAGTCAGMTLGQNSSLNGFIPFPTTDPWRQVITAAAVDPNSAAIISYIGSTTPIHPDFGSGDIGKSTIGIPYQVVSGQPTVAIAYTQSASESDPGPMPIPADALIEGYPKSGGAGDKHVLVLDRDNCFLYELYNSKLQSDGSWKADSGAVWDLNNDNQRPYTWTSADAAGLPIFPGLARYDEVANGAINHALRFTLPATIAAIVPPAKHWAANSTDTYAAPMGMRLRLHGSFDISSYSAQNQVILNALKTYGMILADNGSALYISGDPNDGWNNTDLHALDGVTAADFDVLLENPLYTSSNIPTGSAPVISSFTANPTSITSGSSSTLSWSGTGASYYVVSPQIGAVSGNSVAVTPTATTTYTLYSTNQYGRTTATVQVTVE
jgi:hypothetical protein